MSYLYSKGKRVFGDIIGEDDSDGDTIIDFGEDRIDLQTNGSTRFKISGSNGAITFNEAYTFPAADGDLDQVLVTDGSGELIWAGMPPASAEVVMAHLSSDFTFTTTATDEFQTVPFNSVLKDSFPSAAFNTETNLFTAPAEGYYEISVQLYHRNMNNIDQYQTRISSSCSWAEANGAIAFYQYKPNEHSTISTHMHQLSRIAHLSGSDTVGITFRTIKTGADEGSSIHSGKHLSYFTVRKL